MGKDRDSRSATSMPSRQSKFGSKISQTSAVGTLISSRGLTALTRLAGQETSQELDPENHRPAAIGPQTAKPATATTTPNTSAAQTRIPKTGPSAKSARY